MGVKQLVCGPNHEQNKKDNNTTENILVPVVCLKGGE